MKVALMTSDEIRELVAEAVDVALAKVRPAPEPASDIMSTEQVAAMLGVNPRTVRNLVRDQGLPYAARVGKLWRFRRSEVIEWMKGRRKSA